MNHTEPPPSSPSAPTSGRPSTSTRWWVGGLILAVAVAAYLLFSPAKTATDSTARPGGTAFGGGGGGRGGRGGFGRGGGPVPVSTTVAVSGELRVYLSALGSVNALNTITVRSRADGELQKIHFAEGQLVQAGDLLAEIDPRSYQVALAQAQGQLARDTAVLENARRDLERYQNAKEAVTQQQVDAAAATVAQYAGTVRADQASVDNDQLLLSYCRITAPIAGRVGLKLVDQGNLIGANASTGIVVITQEEPIAVVFSIPEDNLPPIRRALAAGEELAVDAFDRGMVVHLATGKLAAMDNQIDLASGTVRLKAVFANADHGLFPNQFVNVRMLTDTLKNVTIVPNSAVQIATTSRFVFVVKPDSTVERRNVTVGRSEGEKTIITEGLAVGETVVTQGLDSLQNGSKVVAMTPPPAGRGDAGGGRRGGRGGDGSGGGGRRGGRGGDGGAGDGGGQNSQGKQP